MTTDTRPSVLFVCIHNAGRSQMALGFFNHHAGDAAIAWSGGSEPGTSVNPAAIAVVNATAISGSIYASSIATVNSFNSAARPSATLSNRFSTVGARSMIWGLPVEDVSFRLESSTPGTSEASIQ